ISGNAGSALKRITGTKATTLTAANVNVSFASIRRDALSRAEKKRGPINIGRRDFLIQFSQTAGPAFLPTALCTFSLPFTPLAFAADSTSAREDFYVHPHYRSQRPIDSLLLKTKAGLDEFVNEKYAEQIGEILARWSSDLLRSPASLQSIADTLAA